MKRIDLHPLPLRTWHWINALIVILLIATGLYLRLHGIAALKPHDPVLLWHKGLGFASMAATVFWFIYTMSNGKLRRHYRIKRSDLRGGIAQLKFYLVSILRGQANPFHPSAESKYNPLQKAAYVAVMFVFLPVQAITGLLFFDTPVRGYLLNMIGWIDAVHVLFTYLLVLYHSCPK